MVLRRGVLERGDGGGGEFEGDWVLVGIGEGEGSGEGVGLDGGVDGAASHPLSDDLPVRARWELVREPVSLVPPKVPVSCSGVWSRSRRMYRGVPKKSPLRSRLGR